MEGSALQLSAACSGCAADSGLLHMNRCTGFDRVGYGQLECLGVTLATAEATRARLVATQDNNMICDLKSTLSIRDRKSTR